MEQLTLQLRAHDLPPSWDGAPVDWEPWDNSSVTLCVRGSHRERCHRCEHCGSNASPMTAHGIRRIPHGLWGAKKKEEVNEKQ